MSFLKKTLLIISITIGLASVSKAEYYTFGLDEKNALPTILELCQKLDQHRLGTATEADFSIAIKGQQYHIFCDAEQLKDPLNILSKKRLKEIPQEKFAHHLNNNTLCLTRGTESSFTISVTGTPASFNLVNKHNISRINKSAKADRSKDAEDLLYKIYQLTQSKDLAAKKSFLLLGEEMQLIEKSGEDFTPIFEVLSKEEPLNASNIADYRADILKMLQDGYISVVHVAHDQRIKIILNTPECLLYNINYDIAAPQHAGGLDLAGLLAAAAAKQKPVAVDKRLGLFWQPSQLYTVSSQQHRAPTFPDFANDKKALNALKSHFRSCHYDNSICLDENIYQVTSGLNDRIFFEDDRLDAITFDNTDITKTHWYTLTFRTYGEFKLGLNQQFGDDHRPTFETETDIKQLITRLMIPNNLNIFRYEGINYLIQSTERYFLGNAGDPTAIDMYIEDLGPGEKLPNVAGHTEKYQARLGFEGKPNKALTFSLSIPLLQDNIEQALDVFPRFADRNADNDEIKRISTQFIISAQLKEATTFKANLSSNIDLSLHVDREIDALTLIQLWNLDETIQDTDLDKVEELVTVRRISEVIDNMDGTSSCRYLISYKRLEGNFDYNFTITANN